MYALPRELAGVRLNYITWANEAVLDPDIQAHWYKHTYKRIIPLCFHSLICLL